MTSSDLRSRLLSLKNITQDLKMSTTTPALDLAHIRTLITDLKGLSDQPSTSYPPRHSNQQDSDQLSSDYYHTQRPPLKPNPQTIIHEKQVLALREQNLKLEQKLLQLKEQLQNKERVQIKPQEPRQNQLPYFKHTEVLKAFVCRFQIVENDYGKVDYVTDKVELHLDKLVLTHRKKGEVEEFDLTTLLDVQYLPLCTILYRLKEFVEVGDIASSSNASQKIPITNIFIRYDSPEQLRKWDLSIYSNYQLSTSLQQPKVFQGHFRRLKLQQAVNKHQNFIHEIKTTKELSLLQQKQLLQYYLKKKQEYVDAKNIVQEKIPLKVKEKDPPLQEQSKEGSSQKLIKIVLENQLQNVPKQAPQLKPINEQPVEENIDKQSVEINKPEDIVQIKEKIESDPARKRQFSFSKEEKVFPAFNPNYQVNNEQMWQSVPYQGGSSSPAQLYQSSFNTAGTLTQQVAPLKIVQNRVTTARQNLQQGYQATKYSKDGMFFHQKRVFLSLDCKKLCWSEKDHESEYKSVPLEVITKVQYGIIGQGIAKHVKKNLNPFDYCVLEYYTGDYKKKTIELGGTPYLIRRFAQELQIIISYNKGSSLNALVES